MNPDIGFLVVGVLLRTKDFSLNPQEKTLSRMLGFKQTFWCPKTSCSFYVEYTVDPKSLVVPFLYLLRVRYTSKLCIVSIWRPKRKRNPFHLSVLNTIESV